MAQSRIFIIPELKPARLKYRHPFRNSNLQLERFFTEPQIVPYFFRLKISELYKMHTVNLLDQLTPKNLSIHDLKKCYNINNIWKDEVIREIRKRLIVNCTFIRAKVTVKALIDSKSFHGSISKALAQKMGLYISREYGSGYPAVRDLGINVTNASKKVMRRGWVDRKEVSVTLPNIFDGIVSPLYFGNDTANFVVLDKPEYDLVLGTVWLMHIGYDVDRHQTPS